MSNSFRFLVALCLFSASFPLQAQTPFINSISKKQASVNDTIAVSGHHFGSSAADLVVFFGSARGQVVSVEDRLIKVLVPAAATFAPIRVTRLSQAFTVSSAEAFLPTYQAQAFQKEHIAEVLQLGNEEQELYDLCACDFDGDNDNDIATTNNSTEALSTSVSVFTNQTTDPANSLFQYHPPLNNSLRIDAPARNVICGDLNGDGKPELIVSQGGDAAENVYIYQNTSAGSISFGAKIIVSLNDEGLTNGARKLALHDINGDGRPEIIVSNQTNNKIFILSNESLGSDIVFKQQDIFSLEVPGNTLGLAVADLNRDLLPEIIVTHNLGNHVYILRNKSGLNHIAFDTPLTVSASGTLVNVAAGDMDGDGLTDIVATDFTGNKLHVWLNQSSNSDIRLGSPLGINTGRQPWGTDIGDLDGNGKADLLVATLHAEDSITLLLNHSTPGQLDFRHTAIGKAGTFRELRVADINLDAKPEVVFTEQDETGNFHVRAFKNMHCLQAIIQPAQPGAVCENQAVRLYATPAAAVSYQWLKDGQEISGATQASLSVNTAGDYRVRITSAHDQCVSLSEAVTVAEDEGDSPTAPEISGPDKVCAGENIQLSAGTVSGATYHWTGPNGFSASQQTIQLNAVTVGQAGEYTLRVQKGACISLISTHIIAVYAYPEVQLTSSNGMVLCQDGSTSLTASYPAATAYQWKKDGRLISGATAETLEVSAAGAYTVSVTTDMGCQISSQPLSIRSQNIQAAFQAHARVCAGEEVLFTDESVTEETGTVVYAWDFGDNQTASTRNPAHIFTESGTFEVRLQITDPESQCTDEIRKSIEVVALPALQLLPDSAVLYACEGDTLRLQAQGSFASLRWQDGSTGSSLLVSKPGKYQLTAYNDFGCSVSLETEVIRQEGPFISISADHDHIAKGSSTTLRASGASTYAWSPATGLDNASSATPVASPTQTTTYVLTASEAGGCSSVDSITIYVMADYALIKPNNLFSPNNDGIDDYWLIQDIEQYPDCGFKIFNVQGNLVFESASHYTNNWNGLDRRGKPLAEGVYYYVMNCGNGKHKTSGSITLLR